MDDHTARQYHESVLENTAGLVALFTELMFKLNGVEMTDEDVEALARTSYEALMGLSLDELHEYGDILGKRIYQLEEHFARINAAPMN